MTFNKSFFKPTHYPIFPMRVKIIILLGVVLFASPVLSQPDSLRAFQFPPHESFSTKLEHAGYVCGASLVFALVDYLGYNLVRGDNGAPFSFRLGMIALQTG